MGAPAVKKKFANRKLNLKEVVESLRKTGLVDDDVATDILVKNTMSKRHPLEIISEFKIIDRRAGKAPLNIDRLTEWLAKIVNMTYLKIDPMEIDFHQVGGLIPQAYALRLKVLPISLIDDVLTVATAEPFEIDWINEISKIIKKEIRLVFASPIQLKILLDEFFVVQGELGKNQSAEQKQLLREGKVDELDKLIELGRQKNYGGKSNSVVKIVDWLLNFASAERASDIHLEPKKGMGQIRFRVDGKLKVVYKMDPESLLNVVSRLKVLGEMKLDEKRKPQDGRVKRFLDNGKKVEMRLSVIPSYYGEKMVIRIFDNQVANKNLDFIGFSPEDKIIWESMINSTQGLLLVTGPTGSGKTTTLYTSLNLVASEEVNVCTVEDPIEMTVDSINQVQVNHKIGMGFSECIRAFLRQDPDIIMVGEIRDFETGEVAIQSSLTGHLVFSTLHTNGALATIQRLIDLGLPSFLINSSVKGILAQRLVRTLCPDCKVETPTPKAKWDSLVQELSIEMPKTVFEPKGCVDCKDLGYIGRMCVYELVEMKDSIRDAIHSKVEMSELKEKTKGQFVPFRKNCADKVMSGQTTIDEVLKVVY
jgi:general secretion pathway protein E